jgi:hypothetical protein
MFENKEAEELYEIFQVSCRLLNVKYEIGEYNSCSINTFVISNNDISLIKSNTYNLKIHYNLSNTFLLTSYDIKNQLIVSEVLYDCLLNQEYFKCDMQYGIDFFIKCFDDSWDRNLFGKHFSFSKQDIVVKIEYKGINSISVEVKQKDNVIIQYKYNKKYTPFLPTPKYLFEIINKHLV